MSASIWNRGTLEKLIINIFVLLILQGYGLLIYADAAIPSIERNGLIAIYNNTDGDNWTANDGWKTPPLDTDGFAMPGTECDWHGITCDPVDTNIGDIRLYSNNLIGRIPAEIGNFSKLKVLWLTNNNLSGNIPAQVGNLSELEELYLENNELNGNIPPDLGNLQNLVNLDLSMNGLTGNIPVKLSDLAKLEFLSLTSNALDGDIPSELGRLSQLVYFYLGNNELTGTIPPTLGQLSNLQWLILEQNQLHGNIPAQLGNLSELERLRLGGNELTGQIPTELGNLSKLRLLWLGGNNLIGEIPTQLGNLYNLLWLDLSNNQLIGKIPAQLGAIPYLESLALSNNRLTGNIPSELGNFAYLIELYLSSNELVGEIPEEFMNLTNLTRLTICYNHLYTNDPALRNFIENLIPGWENCQDLVGIIDLESTFDTGFEGWQIYGDGTNLTYHPDSGNPGGFISADDLAQGQTWFFLSPDKWFGDWRPYLGGTISFDLKLISGNTDNYYSAADVIIDTDGSGHYAMWSSDIDPAPGVWTHYEVRLSKSNFEIRGDRTWEEIISNVNYLLIRGEHIEGLDTEGVDNIRVTKGQIIICPQMNFLLFGN